MAGASWIVWLPFAAVLFYTLSVLVAAHGGAVVGERAAASIYVPRHAEPVSVPVLADGFDAGRTGCGHHR